MADGAQIGTSIGSGVSRIDGRLKVTGAAHYGSDAKPANCAHGYLVTSPIALGKITKIDDAGTRAVPGVLEVLTYQNVGDKIDPGKTFDQGGYMGTSIAPLASAEIKHDGQIVALVIADTFESAREGAQRLAISYDQKTPTAGFDGSNADIVEANKASKQFSDPKVGDAQAAFKNAAVTVEANYSTPTQHHNPIELFTTTCEWRGDKLTIWESSQNMYGFKHGVAKQLGIDPSTVHVISPFIGGAFGSRGSLTQRTAIVALASKRVGRPVQLETTRDQGFTVATYRAETRHHVKFAASQDGKLQAYIHQGWEVSSRPDAYKVGGTETTSVLYNCPNIDTKVYIVHADRNTPGFMRSPPEVPYMFATEVALDELAEKLNMDPVELRRINDTMVEPIKGRKYTSRALMPCFDAAAKAFGWNKRNAKPKQTRMTDEKGEWLVGYGCATTAYPTNMGPATARVIVSSDGRAKVQAAGHEIGVGIYTVIAQTAADTLGLPIDKITVELGDSDFPPVPVAGGSNSTASVCTVVAKACADLNAKLAAAAVSVKGGKFTNRDPKTLQVADGMLRAADGTAVPVADVLNEVGGAIEAYAENIPHGVSADGIKKAYQGQNELMGGSKLKDRVQFAFGAQFVEVHVHARTGEVRVPRAVGAYAAGRIINPKTAHSQLMGGLIWGISAALHEATEIDARAARYTNDDLAEYLIPVNADIKDIDIIMLPEDDTEINPLGIKGVGELGNVGVNAAVVNAIYNATGVRVRDLPVRVEKLLTGLDI